MRFEYQGKTWLRDGFTFPGLMDYIETTKETLAKPLRVPVYATAGERERMDEISEKFKENPYLSRVSYNQAVKNMNKSFLSVKNIPYGEYPVLYNVCIFAASKLMNMTPLVFLYQSDKPDYRYNAFALDYQDKVWIYISDQFFREHAMLLEEELCFLVGHELGHAQCHHSTITMSSSRAYTSDVEFSADRAGMLVCARRLLEKHPEYTVEQAGKLAVLYAASTLMKLDLAMKNGSEKINWGNFNYEKLSLDIACIFDGASRLSVSQSSHPHDPHRIMALVHFRQSELFYRCMGADPDTHYNLYSDQQLQNNMASLLVDG